MHLADTTMGEQKQVETCNNSKLESDAPKGEILKEFSAAVLDLYRGASEQPVSTFQNWAFERIKTVLPFDSALWLTGTLINGEATFHSLLLHRQPPQLMTDWARCKDKAVFAVRVFGSPGVTFNCVTSLGFGPELAEHSRRYNVEHILATTSIDPISTLHELISIYRADMDKPFSEEERLLQQNLVPHLAETWRINRLNHFNQVSQPLYAVNFHSAAADIKGILHLIEPSFISLLLGEWPGWRGPYLPDGLISCTNNQDGRFVGNTLVIRFSRLNDLFLLRGRKKSRVDSLSQREREVANHFSSGNTHKEIAQTLKLSPATVRNYLSAVYLKLEISNKAELVNILKDYD